MTEAEVMARAGGTCEFCGAADALQPVAFAPAGAVALCPACRGETDTGPDHFRCLEGAAWSGEPVVQFAVWQRLGTIEAPWASETRAGMALSPEAEAWANAPQAVTHRDSNGAILANGDTVTLIKDLPVKGAGFTAKRGTAVRGITLVPDNAAHIEGRVEGQRIVILTEFVKKR
ncbi:PhnA domain-containing protein [Gemmobacter serpentinus]|uniref:PhnA domain-containing protein n=1 Tax=Gemmobacter serpentinus TaxID=2652247 RepID=UPI00124D8799|nr:alkylphosphonate utilization protein [Gemmobacter serpentinus]